MCRITGETRQDPERLALCLVKSRLIWPRVHAFLLLDDDGADVDLLRARRRMLQDATSPRRAISRRDKDEYLDTCTPGMHASCRRFLQVRGTSPSEEEDLDLCHRVDAAVAVTRERGMTNPVRLWRPEPSAVFVASAAAATGAAAAARPGNDGSGRGDDDDDERYFWTGFWTGTLHRSVDAISVRAAFETGTLLVPLDADDVLSCARAACGFLASSKFSDYIGQRVLIASRDWRILSLLKEDHNVPYASPMQFRMTRCGSSPSSSSNCHGAVLVFPGRDSCDVSVTASLLPRRDDGSTPTRSSKSESLCATSAPRPYVDDRSCLSELFVLPSSSRGGVYGRARQAGFFGGERRLARVDRQHLPVFHRSRRRPQLPRRIRLVDLRQIGTDARDGDDNRACTGRRGRHRLLDDADQCTNCLRVWRTVLRVGEWWENPR